MNLSLLIPQIILSMTALMVLLSIAVKRNRRVVFGLTLLGTALSFASLFDLSGFRHQVSTLFVVDGLSIFFTGLILLATFFIGVFSYSYFKNKKKSQPEEYYLLLLLATVGATAMVVSNHFIAFFLSLEVMSVSMYSLIAYFKEKTVSVEAALKYLVMAGVSSAILLFGIALLYAHTGVMELSGMSVTIQSSPDNIIFISGIAFVIVGIGFKLALVPFHLWTPDIYAGASAPVSAFVATISKGAVLVFLLRFYLNLNDGIHQSLWITFAVIAVASMLIGNWLALRQNNVKRLLAYSSIGHLGYMIVALLASSESGIEAVAFYLVAYFIGMIAAFGIVGYLSRKDSGEMLHINDYKGLFWKKPRIAALFTGVLLSLAGIPLTAGFLGKMYLLFAGVGSNLWFLVIVLIISSGIGLYYYLRVVVVLFARSDQKEDPHKISVNSSPFTSILLFCLFVFLFWVGVFPSGLIDLIHHLIAPVY